MIIYDKIYVGKEKSLAKKSFLDTISELDKAKNLGVSFFFISSSFVFDRSLKNEYTEVSKPNSKSLPALFLIETENRVLSYNKGYVYRKQDLFNEINPLLEEIKSFEGEPVFSEESLRLLSYETYMLLLNGAITKSLFEEKLIHFAIPTESPIHLLWFYIRGLPFAIGDNPNLTSGGTFGFLSSNVLKKLSFYDILLEKNYNDVIDSIKSQSILER